MSSAPMSSTPVTPSAASGRRLLGALWPFLRPYRARLAVALVALIVAAAATLILPICFRQLIDLGFVSQRLQSTPAAEVNPQLNLVFAALMAVAVLLALGTALRFYSVAWLGERVSADLRDAVYRHVLRLDPAFFETLRPGEILSRLTADSTLVQTLVGTSVSMGLRNALLFVGSLILMMITSPALAAMITGLILLVMLPILLFGRRVRGLSRRSQDRLADTSALAGERLGAIQVVQAFAREDTEADRFEAATQVAFEAATRRVRARATLTAMAITLIFAAIVFVLWTGARAVVAGTMSPGVLMQFILYATLVAGSTGALSEVLGDVQRAIGATERLMELLAVEPALVAQPALVAGAGAGAGAAAVAVAGRGDGLPAGMGGAAVSADARSTGDAGGTGDATLDTDRRRGATVRIEALTFYYPSRPDEAALWHIDLAVSAGETVAIVGPSGAGKSTLFQMLLRFHDPQAGRILLDGVDIRSLDPRELRRRIGIVAQDNAVFSGDAMANIRYGRLDADDDAVRAAARAAHADDFLRALPDGYATQLGERGVRLSGGQRQRIAIARALLKNPALLLLDEATSALDAESERLIQDALERAQQGRTTLVIAHRLATVIGADRIVVMDGGRIVEQGRHRELLAAGGLYARLARLQFGIQESATRGSALG